MQGKAIIIEYVRAVLRGMRRREGTLLSMGGRYCRFNCGCYFVEWQEGTSSGNADKEREYSITGGLVTA